MSKKPSAFKTSLQLVTLGAVAAGAYALWVRPRTLYWGATPDEVSRILPGDELVTNPKLNITHAITINAPASSIWPWLVQLGQNRGGFYSLTWVENIMGLNIHNADSIHPEWQNLQVGDMVALAPNGFGIPVFIINPERCLVLHGAPGLAPTGAGEAPAGLKVSWGFYLEPIDALTTRLVERWRMDWIPSLQSDVVMHTFMEPGAFVMERAMLLGIKQRAEKLHNGEKTVIM